MRSNVTADNWLNERKHRSRSRAVLSALPKIFGVILFLGAILLLAKFTGFLNPKIPGRISGTYQAVALPQQVEIPAINVKAPVTTLNLNADGSLQVPEHDNEVGWYTGSPAPGAIGPSVMVGHLDSVRGAAVFANLHKLKPGDTIKILRKDNTTVEYKVESLETYPQNQFPSDKVYGALDYPGLRLITCIGTYSRLIGRYSDNLVVYARMVQ